jgi:tetratricopeptide (TPR) repeat protein
MIKDDPVRITGRKIFGLDPNDRLYHEVVQALFSYSSSASSGFLFDKIQALIRDSRRGHHTGALLLLLYVKGGEGGLQPEDAGLADRLFRVLKDNAEGRLWNHFNYARLLARQNRAGHEREVLEGLVALLSRSRIEECEFLGAPCLGIEDPFYTELNLACFRGGAAARREITRLLLGISLARAGQLMAERSGEKDAVVYLERAVEMMPENEAVHLLLGRIYASLNSRKSLEALKTAFALNPFHPGSWQLLVAEYARAGKREEALAFLMEIKRLKHLSARLYGPLSVDLDDMGAKIRGAVS